MLAAALLLTGCVTSETKPIPHIAAQQATVHIPDAELLDVGIRVFDPGIPKNIEGDDEALAKKRIYPDLRKAEARYIPTLLRETLESSAQWGAVRVIPNMAEFVDVIVTGKMIESNGGFLSLEVTVTDAAGRVWIKDKRYESMADLGVYKTSASLKARDPFQNIYSEVAQRHGAGARQAHGAGPREHPQGRQPEICRRSRPRRHGRHDLQGQERHHAGGAPAGRR